jgi:hypothetical protein
VIQPIFDTHQAAITETPGFEDTTLTPHSVAKLHEELGLLNACVNTDTTALDALEEMERKYHAEGNVSFAQLLRCKEACRAHIYALENLLWSKWLWTNDGLKILLVKITAELDVEFHRSLQGPLRRWGWGLSVSGRKEDCVVEERVLTIFRATGNIRWSSTGGGRLIGRPMG